MNSYVSLLRNEVVFLNKNFAYSLLDHIKRRQLPAWIREGLEKMEREKLKAVERERQEILRKQEVEARKKIEDQARAVLNPSKSKFVSIIHLFQGKL